MNRKWSQVLWLLSAILLIGAGVICIMNPMTALSSIAWIIAIAILFEGFSDIVGYFFFRDTFFSNAWMLIDGILSVVMACFLIGYNDITAAFIPYIFSGWLLVTSLAKFINSFQMRRFNFASWNWMCALGIVGIAFSIFAFFNPSLAILTINVLLGALLIFQGLVTLIRWYLCLNF